MDLINQPSAYQAQEEKYLDHLFEQYKLYVEMADRISQRRSQTNTFFLGLNTVVATGFSIVIENIENIILNPYSSYTVLIILLLGVAAWILLLRSYRNLNTAKYKVIGEFEKHLPASPFWNAEWTELGQGKELKKYLPLSVVETIVPFLFAIIYIVVLL